MRTTTKMDEDLKKEVEKMANDKKWPFDLMCYELIKQAVKERKRKRKKSDGKEI